MLNEVLTQLNNYFIGDTIHEADVTFTTPDTLEGVFTDTFQAGQYILISGSALNDGVYKISAITDTTITIDATVDIVVTSESEVIVSLTQCTIPKSLIAVIDDISTYATNTQDGLASESQGSRSVSYNGGSSWAVAFTDRLSPYRKLRWS